MEFRPCIDIHNGKVKQIVGGSLKDEGNQAKENFVAEQDAAYFAKLYQLAAAFMQRMPKNLSRQEPVM